MTRRDAAGGWIVLLEAADGGTGSTIDARSVDRLVAAWATPAPTALRSPSRYAVQVSLTAADPASALAAAIRLWKEALSRTGLPEWDLVRAEVMTPTELQQELEEAEAADDDVEIPPPVAPAVPDPVGDELLRRALHDPVTGLANREIFLHDVRRALAVPCPPPAAHAVMVVGLDAARSPAQPGADVPGDDVMVEVARRLTEAVRDGDSVARVGPAQFALLARLRSSTGTDRLAKRVVRSVGWPILEQAGPAPLMASVGVATMSAPGDADDLILMAEVAMRAARDAGGDCHRQFAVSPGGT